MFNIGLPEIITILVVVAVFLFLYWRSRGKKSGVK